jgi:hypothetical protein
MPVHCVHLHLPATKSGGEHDGATDFAILLPSHAGQQIAEVSSRSNHQILRQSRPDEVEIVGLNSGPRLDTKLLRQFAARQLNLQWLTPVQLIPVQKQQN